MSNSFEDATANASREEVISALFANLVMQQTNMAFMFLGRMPHPETGEVMQDLESAQFFISQLEMLEIKTKGNLDKREENLLKQSLTNLRLAFFEAVEKPEAPAAPKATSTPASVPETPKASEPAKQPDSAAEKAAAEESKKKFTKKY